MDQQKDRLVLVTGGSGFLGAHCVLQLLQQGYRVRSTIRNMNREAEVREMIKNGGAPSLENLSFMKADLSKDENWEAAVRDCDFVLHVASPFPIKMPKDENELIRPAVDGTLRVLNAASKMGVKRVVLTSSFAAIGYGKKNLKEKFTEVDWTDPNDSNISAYVKSKTLAEQAAWDFMEKDGGGMELAVINPRYILGPALGRNFTTSLTAMKQIFDGSMKRLPNVGYGIVDVRDVADLHIRAMQHPEAKGQRFLASNDEPVSFPEIAQLLRDKLGDKARNVSTKVFPNWLVRVAALFNPVARGIAPVLGKRLVSSSDKAKNTLGWTLRSSEEAILASVDSIMKAEGQG